MADYTAHIRRLLASRACAKISFSPAGEKLAATFSQRQVPVEVVKHGILLECTRKYMTLLTTPNSGAVVNPSYFQNATEEAAASKVSSDDWRYLRRRVDELQKEWVQKTGLSHWSTIGGPPLGLAIR